MFMKWISELNDGSSCKDVSRFENFTRIYMALFPGHEFSCILLEFYDQYLDYLRSGLVRRPYTECQPRCDFSLSDVQSMPI
jgi:hypothetical protein